MAKGKKRKPDLRRIRPSKVYTLPEIAKTMDRKSATIRSWVRKGLPLVSEQKPVLVLGASLKEWLQETWKAKTRKCQPGEMFCFKCRRPGKPKPGSVKLTARNEKTVSIKGRCAVCDTRMYQAGSLAAVEEIKKRFSPLTPQMQHLTGCSNTSVMHTLQACEADGEESG